MGVIGGGRAPSTTMSRLNRVSAAVKGHTLILLVSNFGPNIYIIICVVMKVLYNKTVIT